MKRVAVLISGRGSNLGALMAAAGPAYRIVLVIANIQSRMMIFFISLPLWCVADAYKNFGADRVAFLRE